MHKHYILAAPVYTFSNQIDQPRHALPGIDGIQEDTLEPGQHPDGFDRTQRRYTVALSHIVSVRNNMLAGNGTRTAGQFSCRCRKSKNILFLVLSVSTNADTQNRNTAVYSSSPACVPVLPVACITSSILRFWSFAWVTSSSAALT